MAAKRKTAAKRGAKKTMKRVAGKAKAKVGGARKKAGAKRTRTAKPAI